MLLMELLRFAAGYTGEESVERLLQAAVSASDREFRWLIGAGLGPLLRFSLASVLNDLSGARQDLLLAADLVAQIRYGEIAETALEIIDAAASIGAPLTLLKGISIGDQFYPRPYFRPMSDIDVLIPASTYEDVEAKILARGFTRSPSPMPENLNHGTPLFDVVRGNWVDLHTGLFDRSSELVDGHFFESTHVWAQSLPSSFGMREVRRLSPAMQLAYVSSSWNRDITLMKYHPSFVAGLFDAVYLLANSRDAIKWPDLVKALDNPMAAASLLIMMSFLERNDLCPNPPALASLASRQKLVGHVQLRLIHAGIRHFLLGGRVWSVPFPPPVAGRYNIHRQLRKRLARHWNDSI